VRILLLVLAALVLLPACDTKVSCARPQDCIDADEAEADRVWECVDQECQALPCEVEGDCVIEQYCGQYADPEDEEAPTEGFCTEGCRTDLDCRGGDICQSGECTPRPCRSGHLDCELAEFCQGGECVPAGYPFCETCDPLQNAFLNEFTCDDVVVLGHPTCGDGAFCWNLQGGQTCGVPCEDNSDCPGGFSCGHALRVNNACENNFQILGKFCSSDQCFQ